METQKTLAEIIGSNITKLRKSANMTQLELAEKLNYSDKSVSKWEQGNGIPDVQILVRLAELFGVSLDTLVKDHGEREIVSKNSLAYRRLRTFFLASGVCWLVAVVCFVLTVIIRGNYDMAWLSFVYAVPVNAIVVLVLSSVWGYKTVRVVSISVLIWTILASVYVSTLTLNLWLLFLIGVPLQVLTLFFFVWRKDAHFHDGV